MKKVLIPILLLILTTSIFAQPTFDLGLKAGINNSKIDFNKSNYTSETIVKSHFGAFGRAGWGRIFVQPEAYFSAKGGDLSENLYQKITSFNYNAVDVPVLLGVKIIKGNSFDFHAVAGPVFSFLTSKKVKGDELLTQEFYKNNYYGFQYGLGIDVWFLTLDARMEHGSSNLYSYPSFDGKNSTFMISVGFKIL
ncbi:MAG: PorT family protein [Draconibacterium sp.]|nr:PorT family protein [Draconibacterium sp.]